jgi:hypothetical protein
VKRECSVKEEFLSVLLRTGAFSNHRNGVRDVKEILKKKIFWEVIGTHKIYL